MPKFLDRFSNNGLFDRAFWTRLPIGAVAVFLPPFRTILRVSKTQK